MRPSPTHRSWREDLIAGTEGHRGHRSRWRPLRLDPDDVPDEVVARAKAAFELHSGRGEVAVLVADSLVEGDAVGANDYWLGFEHASCQARVHVNCGEGRCDLRGRIEPADAAGVVALEPEGAETALLEQVRNGEFGLVGIAHGLIRLRFAPADGRTEICTDWFRI